MPKVAYCSQCKHEVGMTETGCENGHPMSCLRNVHDSERPGDRAFAVQNAVAASPQSRRASDSSAKDFYYRPFWPIWDASLVVGFVIVAVVSRLSLASRAVDLFFAALFAWRVLWFLRVPYVRITADQMVIAIAPARSKVAFRQSVVQASSAWWDHGIDFLLAEGTKAKVRFWYLRPKDQARLRVELKRFAPSAVDASTAPAETIATQRRTFWLQVQVKAAAVSALIIAALTFFDSTKMMGGPWAPWSGGLVTTRIAMLGAVSRPDQGTAGLFAMFCALVFVVLGLFTMNGRRGAAVAATVLFAIDALGLLYMGSHSMPVTYVALALHVLLLLGLVTGIWALGTLSSEGLPIGNPPLVAAGWFPDPTGRHTQRFWDGVAWTANVSDDGIAAVDQSGTS
jgi:Protein of unknown function (DUF2510)